MLCPRILHADVRLLWCFINWNAFLSLIFLWKYIFLWTQENIKKEIKRLQKHANLLFISFHLLFAIMIAFVKTFKRTKNKNAFINFLSLCMAWHTKDILDFNPCVIGVSIAIHTKKCSFLYLFFFILFYIKINSDKISYTYIWKKRCHQLNSFNARYPFVCFMFVENVTVFSSIYSQSHFFSFFYITLWNYIFMKW